MLRNRRQRRPMPLHPRQLLRVQAGDVEPATGSLGNRPPVKQQCRELRLFRSDPLRLPTCPLVRLPEQGTHRSVRPPRGRRHGPGHHLGRVRLGAARRLGDLARRRLPRPRVHPVQVGPIGACRLAVVRTRHLPRQRRSIRRRLGRGKHQRLMALPGQGNVRRRAAPMPRVIKIGLVESAALALVDRSGVAVAEAMERPGIKLQASAVVPAQADPCAPDRGDGPDQAVDQARPLVGRGDLHPVAHGKRPFAPVGHQAVVLAQFAVPPAYRPQRLVEQIDVLVGVGEHEARPLWPGRPIALPLPHQRRPGLVLA